MENIDTESWSYPQGPSTENKKDNYLANYSPDGKKFAYGSMNNVVVREADVSK